ncbi:TetR/AcrR family transcriptional regulator [Paenibacillus tarimensis]
MPKFADKEKEYIYTLLVEQGRRMFSTMGVKKTSVADLTKAAGIAQGSFYSFFGSKEELFYTILVEEEAKIRSELLAPLLKGGQVTQEEFERFMHQSLRTIPDHPLLRQLYDEQLMEQLVRKLPEEKLKANFKGDADELRPLIERGQREGWMAQEDSDTIVSLIRSVVLLALQRRQIGEAQFEPTMRLLVRLITQGLIVERL